MRSVSTARLDTVEPERWDLNETSPIDRCLAFPVFPFALRLLEPRLRLELASSTFLFAADFVLVKILVLTATSPYSDLRAVNSDLRGKPDLRPPSDFLP